MTKSSDKKKQPKDPEYKYKTVKVPVIKWIRDPWCPKCGRNMGEDDVVSDPFHNVHLEDADLLLFTCNLCGYNWLMECRDARP